jgi:LIVCS family branched-chain amino acid:cation transporter
MQPSKKGSIFVIGLALFAMFFGSGNLIFPLSIGQLAQDQYLWGLTGFICTGVLLPFLGVITMVIYNGDYTRFFGSVGKTLGFLFTIALLTVWIPLGSAPRCITLSYVNASSYVGSIPLWAYSLGYCALLLPLSYRKGRALEILGYVLTPLLLICLGFIVYEGMTLSPGYGPTEAATSTLLYRGLVEGYHTMDLIASFFFTSTVIAALREVSKNAADAKNVIKVTMKSCAVGIVVLGIVYIGLVAVAAANAAVLEGVPKDQLLLKLVTHLLGPQLRVVSTAAVMLACLTTSIALQIVYADFLTNSLFKGKISLKTGMIITMLVTYGMSIQGFEGISRLTGPILEVFYPLLLALMIWNIMLKPLIFKFYKRPAIEA